MHRTTMHRTTILASALALGLAFAAGGLAPAAAQIYSAKRGLDCGAGFDRCMEACNQSIWTWAPPPLPPGRCNDYCAQGSNICEAGRVPRPGGRRAHHH